MNIFIDTNVLHKDYFFKNKSSRQLFNYMREGLINIYMSDIVLLEIRRHYQQDLEGTNHTIERLLRDSTQMGITVNIKKNDISKMLKLFDENYTGLVSKYKNFHILNYSNEMLPLIVEKAIYKKRPFFTEKKSEIKDCLIWLTYSNYIEKKNLNECFLLTDNVADFCDNDKKSVHKDLLSDTKRLIIYPSINNFIEDKAVLIEKPKLEFKEYIDGLVINEEYVKQQLEDNFIDQIEQEVSLYINSEKEYQLYGKYVDSLEDGVAFRFFEIENCEEIKINILAQRALISGIANLSADLDLSQYDYRDDAPESLIVSIRFNYDLLHDEICSYLEISDIDITMI